MPSISFHQITPITFFAACQKTSTVPRRPMGGWDLLLKGFNKCIGNKGESLLLLQRWAFESTEKNENKEEWKMCQWVGRRGTVRHIVDIQPSRTSLCWCGKVRNWLFLKIELSTRKAAPSLGLVRVCWCENFRVILLYHRYSQTQIQRARIHEWNPICSM